MTQNQPISVERAAALLAALVPAVARVELYPQWSDGTGEAVRRTRVIPYDGAGRIIELEPGFHRSLAAVTERLEGVDLDRPQTLDVAARTVTPTFPVVSLPVALWESPRAVVEPDPARDCARSLADGHMTLPVWDDPAPTRQVQEDVALLLGLPGPTQPARPVENVPVQGGAL